jgi:hypothetical protein
MPVKEGKSALLKQIKVQKFTCFEVLDVIFASLEDSSVAQKTFIEA